MKTTLHKSLLPVLVAALYICIRFAVPGTVFAQEASDSATEVEPTMSLTYLCTANDSVILTARLYFMQEREIIALQNAVVTFSASNDKGTKDLGSAITDSTGNAVLIAGPASTFPPNADGLVSYTASFAAAEKFLAASESFQAKPAVLKVEFSEEDSVRYVKVTGTKKDSKGADVPLSGETVKLYVPSLFRPLPIGEISLDENGTGSMEFPKTLVGDSSGFVTVLAQIEESDLYGTVQGKNRIDWAIPKHMIPAEKPTRELWTPVAPLWMIFTLIIMLAGVWAHYVYAVIQLAKIKRSSKVDVWSDKV